MITSFVPRARASLFTITLVVLLFLGSGAAYAADTQEPVFQSINVSPSTGSPGDVITISVSATDNIALDGAAVVYESPNAASWTVPLTYDAAAKKLTGEQTVKYYDIPGTWRVTSIDIWDTSENYTSLFEDEADLSGGDITVVNPHPDTTAPTFNSLQLSTTQTNAGGVVHVVIDATDTESGIVGAVALWTRNEDTLLAILNPDESSTKLEGDIYVMFDLPMGTYSLGSISIYDKQTNSYEWIAADGPAMTGKDIVVRSDPSGPVAGFKDVHPNDWFAQDVFSLVEYDAIGGYSDGTFRPANNVTRAEFAKMICQASGWELLHPATPSFSDMPASNWAYAYVETAKANNVTGGYPGGVFKPGNKITRAEICKMLISATFLDTDTSGTGFVDVPADHWARSFIMTARNNQLVSGYSGNQFRPGAFATRAEAAKMINQSYEYLGVIF